MAPTFGDLTGRRVEYSWHSLAWRQELLNLPTIWKFSDGDLYAEFFYSAVQPIRSLVSKMIIPRAERRSLALYPDVTWHRRAYRLIEKFRAVGAHKLNQLFAPLACKAALFSGNARRT